MSGAYVSWLRERNGIEETDQGDWVVMASGTAEIDQGDWVILPPNSWAERAESNQELRPVVNVVTPSGILRVAANADTTVGEIRQKVYEWRPEYSLERIELVCRDNDGFDGVCFTCSRPRTDDETVKFLWNQCDRPGHFMQMALWLKDKNVETGEWESSFWKEQFKVWEDEQKSFPKGRMNELSESDEKLETSLRSVIALIAVNDRPHCLHSIAVNDRSNSLHWCPHGCPP